MNKPFVIFASAVFLLGFIGLGVHQIPEGYVGLYYMGGALQDTVHLPGWSWMPPLVYTRINVQTTMQTDQVASVPCGSSSGVMLYFDTIEVVNQLSLDHVLTTIRRFGPMYDNAFIFQKIHHEVNQWCSTNSLHEIFVTKFSQLDESLAAALQKDCDSYDTGIKVIAIRVTKPRIPDAVRLNYERAEEAKTELMIAQQEAQVARTRAETERMKMVVASERDAQIAVISAQKEANVSAIVTEKEILVKEGERKKAIIMNDMLVSAEKAKADALYYQLEREAQGNKLKHTPAFLKLELFKALAQNTKVFFGESIPKIFSDWSKEKVASILGTAEE